jgi:hypothetical protein
MALTRIGLNQSINLASNVTGTLPATNGGTGATSFTKGKVLQVTQNTDTSNSQSVSGNSYTDITFDSTVFEGSVTPSSSSNKILILPSIPIRTVYSGGHDARAAVKIAGKIGSGSYSTIFSDPSSAALLGGYDYSGSGMQVGVIFSVNYLWSPSTTSECKVKFQIANNTGSGGSVSINRDGYGASVILIEIEG